MDLALDEGRCDVEKEGRQGERALESCLYGEATLRAG